MKKFITIAVSSMIAKAAVPDVPPNNGKFFYADLWTDNETKIGYRKMNVTLGYPSSKAHDLAISTSSMMSVLATDSC